MCALPSPVFVTLERGGGEQSSEAAGRGIDVEPVRHHGRPQLPAGTAAGRTSAAAPPGGQGEGLCFLCFVPSEPGSRVCPGRGPGRPRPPCSQPSIKAQPRVRAELQRAGGRQRPELFVSTRLFLATPKSVRSNRPHPSACWGSGYLRLQGAGCMEKAPACAWRCLWAWLVRLAGCRSTGMPLCRLALQQAQEAWRGSGREGRPRALQPPRVSHQRDRLLAHWAKLSAFLMPDALSVSCHSNSLRSLLFTC